jgi:hypothetical protein
MTAAELLSAFVGDRISRIEQFHGSDASARPGFIHLRLVFESGRTLIFPIARDVGFSYDDEPWPLARRTGNATTVDEDLPNGQFGMISEGGVAAYPSEEAFLSDWQQDPATRAWHRKKTRGRHSGDPGLDG